MPRIGKPFVRGGKVVAYMYRYGKRTTRDIVVIHQLTPKDLKKGAKRAIVLAAMAKVVKDALEYNP